MAEDISKGEASSQKGDRTPTKLTRRSLITWPNLSGGLPKAEESGEGKSWMERTSVSRREFLKVAGGVGLGILAEKYLGISKFLDPGQEIEKVKRKILVGLLNEAETTEERDFILVEQTRGFIEELGLFEARANNLLASNDRQWEAEKERETARLILERGALLSRAWGLSLKEPEESLTSFDREGRLHLDGRKFSVNEKVADLHLAFNFLRAGLALKVEDDPEKLERLREDYQDLRDFKDQDLNLIVTKKAWVVMPFNWATHVARTGAIFRKIDLPPPVSITIDPSEPNQRNIGGYYESTKNGRFPAGEQRIVLSSLSSPDVSYHEAGHYVADAEYVRKRAIGLERDRTFPDHQQGFDLATSEAQHIFLEKQLDGGGERRDLDAFTSAYAETNPLEDFAETFKFYMNEGPAFRRLITDVESRDPDVANMLKAKYEYIKHIFNGTEFSFEGRRLENEKTDWARARLMGTTLKPGGEGMRSWLEADAKEKEAVMKMNPGMENISIEGVGLVPDPAFALVLLNSDSWRDIIGEPGEITVSSYYSAAHLEISGSFSIKIPRGDVEAEEVFNLDTGNSESITRLITSLDSYRGFRSTLYKIEPTLTDELSAIVEGASVEKPSFAPWGWSSAYPPSFIDNPDLVFARFTEDESGKWKKVPLEVGEMSIYGKIMREGELETDYFNLNAPIRLGKKDVIIGIDDYGRLAQVYFNGVEQTNYDDIGKG